MEGQYLRNGQALSRVLATEKKRGRPKGRKNSVPWGSRVRPICECGKVIAFAAKRCRPCNDAARGSENRKCPSCGGLKTWYAKQCGTCDGAERARPMCTCRGCGRTFRPKQVDRTKYCSRECAFADAKAWMQKRERRPMFCRVHPCEDCGRIVPQNRKRCQPCSDKRAVRPSVQQCVCVDCDTAFDSERRRRRCAPCAGARKRKTIRKSKRAHRAKFGKSWRKRARVLGVAYEPVNRIRVFDRDGWRCQICGAATPKALLGKHKQRAPTLDHRVPISKGGSHTYGNVQCACLSCNVAKSDKIVVGQMPLFVNDLAGGGSREKRKTLGDRARMFPSLNP